MRYLPFVCLLLLLQLTPAPAQDLKVGYVDIAAIQKGYYRTELVRDEFEAMQSKHNSAIEALQARAKVLLDEQDRAKQQLGDPVLSEDARRNLINAAQERVVQLNSLQKELNDVDTKNKEELATKAKQVQQAIAQDIQVIIAEVAEAKDLDFVLNRSFGVNSVPTMPYSSTKRVEDISEQVIIQLNIKANAPAGWAPKEN